MPYKNGLPCLCEVCSCGKHSCGSLAKCRRRPCEHSCETKTRPLTRTSSEYTEKYIPYKLDPVKSCKPLHVAFSSDEPLDSHTTCHGDYVQHPLNERFTREPEVYNPSQQSLDDMTVYKENFTPKVAEISRPVRQVSRTEPAEFDGEPTYRSDFRKWELPAKDRQTNAQGNIAWTPPTNAFDSLTNYTNDYRIYNEKPPKTFKPTTVPIESGPFDATTDYKQTYVKHPIEKRERPDKTVWAKPVRPMDGITTAMVAYPPKPASRRESYKPVNVASLSDQPLSDITTQRCDYQAWQVERPERSKLQDKYISPEGNMESCSTYKKDFHPHPDAVRPERKESIQRVEPTHPFEGSTDYRSCFKNWKVPKPRLCGDSTRSQWTPPTDPFEDRTTSSIHYVPYADFLPPKMCNRNSDAIRSSDQPLETCTTYRHDFIPKGIKCPAAFRLKPMAPANRLIERDVATGHQYFVPAHVTIRNITTNAISRIPLTINCDGDYTFRFPENCTKYVVIPED